MADREKHNDHHQEEQCNPDNDKISLLIGEIYEQLIRMRQDDRELTEQLTSLYDDLCHLRQTLTNTHSNSNTDMAIIPIEIDSPTSSRYQTKQRSDSEPNILSNRQRILTIIDDL